MAGGLEDIGVLCAACSWSRAVVLYFASSHSMYSLYSHHNSTIYCLGGPVGPIRHEGAPAPRRREDTLGERQEGMEVAAPTGTFYKSLSLTSSAGRMVPPGLASSPESGALQVTRQQAGVIWGFASFGSHKTLSRYKLFGGRRSTDF